jgi:putative hemolysin
LDPEPPAIYGAPFFLSVINQFDIHALPYLGVLVLLLICSGLFSSSEVAFFSLNPSQLALINNKDAGRPYQLIRQLLGNPKKLLATLLISNSMVNIGIVLLSNQIVKMIFDFSHNPTMGIIIQVVVVTFMIVLLGEVMPKVYATKKTLGMAYFMSFPIFLIDKILSPVTYLLVVSTGLIERRLKKKGYELSMVELTHAIDISSDINTPADEKKILKGIVKSGNIDVRQIMKPRMDVVAIDVETKFTSLLAKINEVGYSRLPVYETTLDKVVGVIYIKDLIRHLDDGDEFKWSELMRPPFFVPDSKKINDLLQEFQQKKNHIAIVIDEYGGTMGIVTLEDVLEEIVGELVDEFDDDEPLYSKLDEENYVFEGKTLLNDICRVMNIDRAMFDIIPGETATLAGTILELAGKIPDKNEEIKFKDIKFTIESADKRRIKRVEVFKPLTIPNPKT